MLNVLVYSGSDMCQEYEFFVTNARKEKVLDLMIDLERHNINHLVGENPLDTFEKSFIYHVISDSQQSVRLPIADIKTYFKIDMEIDLDDIYDLIEKENELKEKILNS